MYPTEGLLTFCERITALRKARGWTQKTLGNRVGVTKAMISAYETGMRYPGLTVLILLAQVFRVSVDYLLGLERGMTIDIGHLNEEEQSVIQEMVRLLS